MRRNAVVRINERIPFSPRIVKPNVACGAYSTVLFVEHSDASVLLRVLIADSSRTILASIIYEEQFKVLIGLRQDTVYAATEAFLCVIDGYYDGYLGGGHCILVWLHQSESASLRKARLDSWAFASFSATGSKSMGARRAERF